VAALWGRFQEFIRFIPYISGMTETSGRSATIEEVEAHLQMLAPFRQADSPEWASHDLNFGQLRLLLMLGRSGPVSIGQLAATIRVTPATASELVDRLERRGLVHRFHRTDDRRVVDCELSEQGSRLVAQVAGSRRQALRRILSVLTPEELGQLDVLLQTIGERLAGASTESRPFKETSS
jgi:DNA-binding MarR family transcriptional regulator